MKNRSTETSLQDVQHILRILHTYPKEMKLIGFEDLIQPEEVELTRKAWCDLYAKYDGNEKVHFSDNWFPLLYSGYEFFIDLTTPKYTVFESTVDISDYSNHISIEYFESVNELLFLLDAGYDLERYAKNYKDFKTELLFSFFPEE